LKKKLEHLKKRLKTLVLNFTNILIIYFRDVSTSRW